MHMVHMKEDYLTNSTAALDDEEGYAVIALFFQVTDKKCRTLKKVSEFVQAVSEEESDTEIEANLRIGKNGSFKKINWNNYYHYMGGFTTPPCNEVANWVIIREPLQVSESFVSILFVILCRYLLKDGEVYFQKTRQIMFLPLFW